MCWADKPQRVRVWDLPVRLFHWLLVLLIILLWLSGKFGGMDVDLALPGGRSVYLANMDVHMLLGQAVLALVLFRLFWGIMGSSTARFAAFARGPRAAVRYLLAAARGPLPVTTGHSPAGGLMVLLMLFLLLLQGVTGLFASDDIFSSGPLAHLVSSETSAWLTKQHRWSFNLLLLAMGLHVAAVLYYLVRGTNLITAMITGYKPHHQVDPDEASRLRLAPHWLALLLFIAAVFLVWALRWL